MQQSRREIEKKWQERWITENAFKAAKSQEPKCYVLEMFPYPSGRLHVGHTRNYVMGDVIARYKRSLGYNVLHPMGWDAFGLPAENAAIEQGTMPWVWTWQNINSMKGELLLLGLSHDWSREISTCESSYYRHEQELFIRMLEAGLAYKKEALINWDPVDQTVLANEQVVDGRGWRSGAQIEKKSMNQWFLRITEFAEDLLNDLDSLEGMPEQVKAMQRNWIGKAVGAEIFFRVEGLSESIKVFSTRPETIFGCTFLAISCEHQLAKMCAEKSKEALNFISKSTRLDYENQEKLGFFTGLFAINPFDEEHKVPIFIANFVLMEYAAGAVFGCPAHDERDYEFARKYELPVIEVVKSDQLPNSLPGIMCNSSFLNGLGTEQAKEKVISELERLGKGSRTVNYRLRDWGVSRQRFWGCPIPVIYCSNCGMVPVPISQLPVELPKDIKIEGQGNPLEKHSTWKHVPCPSCNLQAVRETDTFDTFFESSWYFLRFTNPQTSEVVSHEDCKYWLPVDIYIGGIEHAVSHCLYARFITKVMRKLGYCQISEPFLRLINQGMVLHHVFTDSKGKYVYPQEVEKIGGQFFHNGLEVKRSARLEKMSKSKKNLISLKEALEKYGADVIRLAVTSDTPPERDLEWNPETIEGCSRFLDRLHSTANKIKEITPGKNDENAALTILTHQTIDLVGRNLESCKLNKAIALLRELYNAIQEAISKGTASGGTILQAFKALIQMLNPFVPHVTEEIWEQLGERKQILHSLWPNADAKIISKDSCTIAVQIAGKYKGVVQASKAEGEKQVLERILFDEQLAKFITGRNIEKTIFIPGKVINLLLS